MSDSDWLKTDKHSQFPVFKFYESFYFIKCSTSEAKGPHFDLESCAWEYLKYGNLFGFKPIQCRYLF